MKRICHICRFKKDQHNLNREDTRFEVEPGSIAEADETEPEESSDHDGSEFDSCVYIKERNGEAVAYLLLYVDDMLIDGADKKVIAEIKADLKREFEMKELGDARRILGMDITRNRERGELRLQQTEYVKKILKKFQLEKAKDASVPFAQHFKLSVDQSPANDEERDEMSRIPYTNIVGSIMYSMICSRPDVAHSISVASRYMSNYGKQH